MIGVAPQQNHLSAKGPGYWVKTILVEGLLLLGLIASVFPFYWVFVMSTNTTSDIYRVPPKVIPGGNLWTNVTNVLTNMDFFQSFANSLIVSLVCTVLALFFCSIAGFTFAKFEFPGRNVLFALLLGTMLIPTAGSTVASFVIMANLGWIGTFLPLIIPGMATAFGIFWMRQYALSAIPNELIDAARLDGCGHLRIYWHVALPALRPALGFFGILTFITSWNDYLWPLIVLNDPRMYTLQVSLTSLKGVYDTDYSMIMAGTLMSTIPLIIIFFLGARQFIANISAGALKF
ncbi:cellobiose transport system permease protein [Thermosporothrix hazakensis]|jgi:cellobiose transport system permease protein|uniref:Cellobiose transport system permease protein n=2 Tax=Thermosporothrix TaxID=768650 RepID=A0A326UE43_THEHA|nr:carbohydrate ABC transporter permease [Thermosporothrix hazakensis]PZW36707.1 cellobiose transport system permease protein [Thermosporothrix hazakensis]BBH89176.1 sugar ABC transporter permease [Thermosporothrix sp. COM3]GCE47358.1 sugar ABC transporter permease [Thermosporothrix hazakensis]